MSDRGPSRQQLDPAAVHNHAAHLRAAVRGAGWRIDAHHIDDGAVDIRASRGHEDALTLTASCRPRVAQAGRGDGLFRGSLVWRVAGPPRGPRAWFRGTRGKLRSNYRAYRSPSDVWTDGAGELNPQAAAAVNLIFAHFHPSLDVRSEAGSFGVEIELGGIALVRFITDLTNLTLTHFASDGELARAPSAAAGVGPRGQLYLDYDDIYLAMAESLLGDVGEAWLEDVSRLGDDVIGRVSLAGQLPLSLEGEIRVAASKSVQARLALPEGGTEQGGSTPGQVRLAPERGLAKWLEKLRETKLGDRELDRAFIVHADDDQRGWLIAQRDRLLRLAELGFLLELDDDELRIELAPGELWLARAVHGSLQLWTELCRERLGF